MLFGCCCWQSILLTAHECLRGRRLWRGKGRISQACGHAEGLLLATSLLWEGFNPPEVLSGENPKVPWGWAGLGALGVLTPHQTRPTFKDHHAQALPFSLLAVLLKVGARNTSETNLEQTGECLEVQVHPGWAQSPGCSLHQQGQDRVGTAVSSCSRWNLFGY